MFAIAFLFVRVLCDCFKSRRLLEAEVLVLRHQLNVLQQRAPHRLCLTWIDRALFVWLYRDYPRILDRVVKKLKLQERRAVIPSRHSLAACRPLHFFEAINGALCGSADKWGRLMEWARILAYITGTVDQELLLRNEYLAAENRILRGQLKGRLK